MSATFELNCPHCDRLYTLSLEKAVSLASRSIRCKECGQAFRLPTEEEIRASAEEPSETDGPSTETREHEHEPEPEGAPVVEVEPQTGHVAPEAPAAVGLFEDAAPLTTIAPPGPVAALGAPSVPASAAPQVVYAMPPKTVSDIANIRKWIVTLGVVGFLLVTTNVILLILTLLRSR